MQLKPAIAFANRCKAVRATNSRYNNKTNLTTEFALRLNSLLNEEREIGYHGAYRVGLAEYWPAVEVVISAVLRKVRASLLGISQDFAQV